jgi:ribosome-associated translation inhibitor RaiA
MQLTATPDAPMVTSDLEDHAAARVKRLNELFCAEPETTIVLTTDAQSRVVADLTVAIRSYRTLKARGKAEEATTAIDKAARKLELKYRLFWARGSFRFGDCC